MRWGAVLLTSLAFAGAAYAASPNEDAVKAFVKAVKRGDDLSIAYPSAVSAREVASLRRVKGCDPTNLMRQKDGRYTVVWACSGGVLGMGVEVTEGRLKSVETFDVVKKPNVGR